MGFNKENYMLRTAEDNIAECVDAFIAGDRVMAKKYLREAIKSKLVKHSVECLKDVYENKTDK